jgi:radical SAM superfamily enzyme YgiQ (UPF0313 family)
MYVLRHVQGQSVPHPSVADIIADFQAARTYYPYVDRIFLADGDALLMPTGQLVQVLSHIRESYPECKRVGVYASPRSIALKTDEDLRLLCDAGLHIVYLGLESGCDAILEQVKKNATAEEIVREGIRVRLSGLKLSVTVINGLGGTALWEEHAIKTGQALSQMKPHYIGSLVLMPDEYSPMYEEIQSGRLPLLNPYEAAAETLLMLEHLDSEGTVFRSNHASNFVDLRGTLNRDKQRMIDTLKRALAGGVQFRPDFLRGI